MELNRTLILKNHTEHSKEETHQEELHDPQDKHLMTLQPPTFSLTNWALTGLLSVALASGGYYVKWLNDEILANRTSIESVMLKHIDEQHNLDIINAKVDILLQFNGVKYNGPDYKSTQVSSDPPK